MAKKTTAAKQEPIGKPLVQVFGMEGGSLGDVDLPKDPHPGRKAGPTMEPVVRAASGKPKISIWDILGH